MKRSLLLSLLVAAGCSSPENAPVNASGELTTASALRLDFEGEVMTADDSEQTVHAQMMFAIGQLHGVAGSGRLDEVQLSNVETALEDGVNRVTYRATLSVSVEDASNIGPTLPLILPRRADREGQEMFYLSYHASCSDPAAEDLKGDNFWIHYRPEQSGCTLEDSDVVRVTATVTPGPERR